MLIKIGYDIVYTATMRTPMVVMLSVHPSRVADLLAPENITCDPPFAIHRRRSNIIMIVSATGVAGWFFRQAVRC